MNSKKNLIRSADEYTRYYGEFRGVDFSNDQSQVNEHRFAYAVNMFKNYASGEGTAIETIPGFRRRTQIGAEDKARQMVIGKSINGIHEFAYLDKTDKKRKKIIFVHAETSLYKWDMETDTTEAFDGIMLANTTSKGFTFNNRFYLLDGNDYYYYDPDTDAFGSVVNTVSYVPTVYKDLPGGERIDSAISEYEYEQRNLLHNTYRHTYVSDGETSRYPLYAPFNLNEPTVKVNGSVQKKNEDYILASHPLSGTVSIDFKEGHIPTPEGDGEYPDIEVIYTDEGDTTYPDTIRKCTLVALFDKRVFLSGNPDYPNHVFWCGISNTTGYEDPTYFGELNYVIDGVENAPITGLIPVADSLAVLKNHAKQDGSVYFHVRQETDENIAPVTYPSQQGLGGYGCLGACVNFLDDPIFISSLGVEAIGQLSVRLERAIEHRSTLIDSKLTSLDLSHAQLAEWNGYLILLVDGCIFMADSRQVYTSARGNMEYEWYYLEGIGVYEDQEAEYYYSPIPYSYDEAKVTVDGVEYELADASEIYDYSLSKARDLVDSAVDDDSDNVKSATLGEDSFNVIIKSTWDGHSLTESGYPKIVEKAIYIEDRGSKTGGTFKKATTIVNIDDNLIFGTENGVLCSFNFDKIENGELKSEWYNFDNRTIYCGVATKMDNCGIPHLAKSTIKKSTVIKFKTMPVTVAKIRVRTNKTAYKSVARLNSRAFDFDDIDFSDFSFATSENSIQTVREKEKHWVEKQHWIYSDEYERPFALNYLAFRYKISGRVKD